MKAIYTKDLDMKIYVKQKGTTYTITLKNGMDEVSEQVVKGIDARDAKVWELTEQYSIEEIIIQEPKKKTQVPNIPVYDEEEASYFFEHNQDIIYKRLIEAVQDGILGKQDTIQLFELNSTGVFMTSQRETWIAGLDDALNYYLNLEDYESCSKVRDLIKML